MVDPQKEFGGLINSLTPLSPLFQNNPLPQLPTLLGWSEREREIPILLPSPGPPARSLFLA